MKIEHLSNSQIQMALKCGQQWAYRYGEQIILPPGFAAIRGKSVDAGVSTNLRQKIESGQDLPVEEIEQAALDHLDLELRGEVMLDPDYGDDFQRARGLVRDEVVGLTRTHTRFIAANLQPVAVQLRVTVMPSESLPVKLVGVIDLLDSEGRIRDTKTSRKSPSSNGAEESDQLTTYDLFHRAHYKKPPSLLQLDALIATPSGRFNVKEVTAPPRTMEDLRALVTRARAVVRMVESEVFTPAPDAAWWCSAKWCGYHGMCPYARGRKRPES